MRVELITDHNAFLSLADEWNDLLQKSDNNNVWLTHEWFRCWWLAYGEGKTPFILWVVNKGKVIGIAPFLLVTRKYRNILKVQEVCFWSSSISPRVDFICMAGCEEQAIEAIVEFLLQNKKKWDIGNFGRLDERSKTCNILYKILERKSIPFRAKASLTSPYILVNSSWEEFYAGKSNKFRKGMRNKINRVNKLGNIEVERVDRHPELSDSLPVMTDVSRKSWKDGNSRSLYSDTNQALFYRELTKIAGERGWVTIWLLKHDKKVIAFEYHLIHSGTVSILRGDYDEEYKEVSPGSFLEFNIIKTMFEELNVKEYDFCGDNYKYMRNWSKTTRQHVVFNLFNSRKYSKLIGFAECTFVPFFKKWYHRT